MSWNVLAGLVELRIDEVTHPDPMPGSVRSAPAAVIRAAFLAQKSPWRLAELTIHATDPEATPAVATWADNATAVLRGTPAAQHVVASNEVWGDLGLHHLLDTRRIEALAPKPWGAQFEINGDAAARVAEIAPELVAMGAERYRATYDSSLDVLTQWVAARDGQAVHELTLSEL